MVQRAAAGLGLAVRGTGRGAISGLCQAGTLSLRALRCGTSSGQCKRQSALSSLRVTTPPLSRSMCTARFVEQVLSPYITFWRCPLEVLQRPANLSRAAASSGDKNDLRSIAALHQTVMCDVNPIQGNRDWILEFMSDDALIRRENLKSLGHGPKELVLLVGNSYAYWHDLFNGRKSFGEKAARRIEEKLGLPRGSLDDVEFATTPGAKMAPKPAAELPGSYEGDRFARWLYKISDRDLRERACDAAMQILYSAYDGQWPPRPPTPEPEPQSKIHHAARQKR